MLGDMLQLPINFPEIHQELMSGKFALQLRDNFGCFQVETCKMIEMKVNKDAKGASGYISFSINVNAVKKCEINATYRASLRTFFHKLK